MEVELHLKAQAKPIKLSAISNAYVKEGMYCLLSDDKKTVTKYPIGDIFRTKESYD